MKKAVNKYWKEFKKLPLNAKIIITAILIGSFFIGIIIQIGSQKLTTRQVSIPFPTPTLIPIPAEVFLSTDKKEVMVNTTFSATINLNSHDTGVEAADFVLSYDRDYLKVATISSGNFFSLYPVKKIEDDSIQISGMANLLEDRIVVPRGEGLVGTIVFEALAATESTKISFDREKTIVANGGKNILGGIKDLIITIK